MSATGAMGIAFVAVILGGIAASWIAAIRGGVRHERALLREHARANRAHYAAIEAAEDDPSFSPEAIENFVAQVVELADGLWRAGELRVLDGRPDADLIRAWAGSRRSRLGDGLKPGKPSIDLLHVVNRENDEEDRVVIRVRLLVHCRHPRVGLFATRYMRLDERWTLGRNHGRWVLLSMGDDPLSGPVLTAPLIPTPSFDTERLREESLGELADAQKVGDDAALSELVGADERPDLALLDLSLLDGRFLPVLIGAKLAHLLEAWEGAVTGSEAPLEVLASADARDALLRPGPGAHLVMHDAVLTSWKATKLDLQRQPPAVEVTVDVEAVRYVETDDGNERTGNETDSHRMVLNWVLELTDSSLVPWRLATSNNPAEAIAGWS